MKQPALQDRITLTPKTRRGKNALQNKTNLWEVTELRESVPCLDGPGFCLTEVRKDDRALDCRWIELPVDKNFDWKLS